MLSCIVFLVTLATSVTSNSTATVLPLPTDNLKCSYVNQPLCRDTGYNQTAFPNLRMHETQDEAEKEMADFARLWTEGTPCSNAIAHFLCSFYFPFCGKVGETEENTTILPCRNLCEAARVGCEQIVDENTAVGWPPFLECENFPERNSTLCFGPEDPSNLVFPPITTVATTEGGSATTPTSRTCLLTVSSQLLLGILALSLLNCCD